jgi:hypothetical protein
MQNRNWILPLLCLVATPGYTSTVDTPFNNHTHLLFHDAGKSTQHTRRSTRGAYFNGDFEIEQPGTYQVSFDRPYRNRMGPPAILDMKFTSGKDHIADHIRNEDGFIVEVPPGKYGFSMLAKGHNRPHHAGIPGVEIAPWETPTAVPLPAAVWLFGSGLIGLIVTTRRKTR